MENKTNFELITPSQTMINQDVEMVVVPGSEGHFGVLSLHAHTLSTLNRGIVTLYDNGNPINEVVVDGGIVDVTPSGCSVLVERAESLNEIDRVDLEKRYNSFKGKENNFENPAEEKANSEEISWLKFVLDNLKG
jgi:F-type H+-transporting ATPase subunit epsilon|tara:strand:- start:1559 stop:1963 length:405 start_codon:yes stop_codon:yes gene_type:complete